MLRDDFDRRYLGLLLLRLLRRRLFGRLFVCRAQSACGGEQCQTHGCSQSKESTIHSSPSIDVGCGRGLYGSPRVGKSAHRKDCAIRHRSAGVSPAAARRPARRCVTTNESRRARRGEDAAPPQAGRLPSHQLPILSVETNFGGRKVEPLIPASGGSPHSPSLTSIRPLTYPARLALFEENRS